MTWGRNYRDRTVVNLVKEPRDGTVVNLVKEPA
jgi:hypothetical protein